MRTFSATAVSAVVLSVLGATAKADVPVLVLPFADSSGGNAKWVETSIQQSLVGDVARGGTFKPIAAPSAGNASDDLAVAISAARQMNAPYVVYGSYEVRNGQLNVVANAIDVERMQLVGGVNVGRRAQDIFGATDALGAHVIGQLNQARGGDATHANNTPLGAVGPINRMQMPLASLPMSYVDWAAAAQRKSVHDRPSLFTKILPNNMVLDNPLEQIPNRLVGTSRDPRSPFSNGMQGGDGNQVTRSDGNFIPKQPSEITGGDGNTIQRGDGNTLSFNRGEVAPSNRERGFGNSMTYNRGPRDTRVNRDAGTGGGNSVNAPAAPAVRPGTGNAVNPGSGRAVTPGSGNAVRPPQNGTSR